jgi:hypothetical protein
MWIYNVSSFVWCAYIVVESIDLELVFAKTLTIRTKRVRRAKALTIPHRIGKASFGKQDITRHIGLLHYIM